jgi:hypothetical protein
MLLEATIDVQITHVSGPVIVNRNHVRGWLTAPGSPAGSGKART